MYNHVDKGFIIIFINFGLIPEKFMIDFSLSTPQSLDSSLAAF